MKERPTFGEVIAALAFLLAVLVISAVVLEPVYHRADFGNGATTALGALILVVGGGASYFLRAKLAQPGQDAAAATVINAGSQGTVNVGDTGDSQAGGAPVVSPLDDDPAAVITPAMRAYSVPTGGSVPVSWQTRGLQGVHTERGTVTQLHELHGDAVAGESQRGGPGVVA